MTDTSTPAISLTKMDIAALRQCDLVSFHHSRDGHSFINATKRCQKTEADPFARDMDYRVSCETYFTSYEPASRSYYRPTFIGFEMIYSYTHDNAWRTIANLLRADDLVILHWEHGSLSSETLRDAGLVGDELKLDVVRGKQKLTFNLSAQVGRSDGAARMIRDVRPTEYSLITAA